MSYELNIMAKAKRFGIILNSRLISHHALPVTPVLLPSHGGHTSFWRFEDELSSCCRDRRKRVFHRNGKGGAAGRRRCLCFLRGHSGVGDGMRRERTKGRGDLPSSHCGLS